MNKYEEFLQRWAADAERLHRIGLHPFGFDPGFLCSVEGQGASVDLSEHLVKTILSPLIQKAHPEMSDDNEMIKAYKARSGGPRVKSKS